MTAKTRTQRFALIFLGVFFITCLGISFASGDPATIAFSLDFPQSDPAHYTVTTTSGGHATYDCAAKVSADSEDTAPYKYEFDLTSATRGRIFQLAAQAKYFSGKVDSGNRNLAFTGAKKLIYTDSSRKNVAEYNYSSQPAVQQLTQLFQAIAATMEYGRRLTFEHRYQKLALDDELTSMEDQQKSGGLQEVQALQPILQSIVQDDSVMNVARARAQRILALASTVPQK